MFSCPRSSYLIDRKLPRVPGKWCTITGYFFIYAGCTPSSWNCASRSFCILNVAYFHVGDIEISRTATEPCVCHCVDLLLSDQLDCLVGYTLKPAFHRGTGSYSGDRDMMCEQAEFVHFAKQITFGLNVREMMFESRPVRACFIGLPRQTPWTTGLIVHGDLRVIDFVKTWDI